MKNLNKILLKQPQINFKKARIINKMLRIETLMK